MARKQWSIRKTRATWAQHRTPDYHVPNSLSDSCVNRQREESDAKRKKRNKAGSVRVWLGIRIAFEVDKAKTSGLQKKVQHCENGTVKLAVLRKQNTT